MYQANVYHAPCREMGVQKLLSIASAVWRADTV
jgi:hypothetical protein